MTSCRATAPSRSMTDALPCHCSLQPVLSSGGQPVLWTLAGSPPPALTINQTTGMVLWVATTSVGASDGNQPLPISVVASNPYGTVRASTSADMLTLLPLSTEQQSLSLRMLGHAAEQCTRRGKTDVSCICMHLSSGFCSRRSTLPCDHHAATSPNVQEKRMCASQDIYSFQLLVQPGYSVSSVTVAPPKTVNAGDMLSLNGTIAQLSGATAEVRAPVLGSKASRRGTYVRSSIYTEPASWGSHRAHADPLHTCAYVAQGELVAIKAQMAGTAQTLSTITAQTLVDGTFSASLPVPQAAAG